YVLADHTDLPSFPTRRSSDLDCQTQMEYREEVAFASEIAQEFTESATEKFSEPQPSELEFYTANRNAETILESDGLPTEAIDIRSEEHTSELQSRFDLVCRLL